MQFKLNSAFCSQITHFIPIGLLKCSKIPDLLCTPVFCLPLGTHKLWFLKTFALQKHHTLKSGINISPLCLYIFKIFIPGPKVVPEALHFIKCWNFVHERRIFSSFLLLFKALHSIFFAKYPNPTFIQGHMFIRFVKISRPYFYFLPYVYFRL